jgi:hypothetical protein
MEILKARPSAFHQAPVRKINDRNMRIARVVG